MSESGALAVAMAEAAALRQAVIALDSALHDASRGRGDDIVESARARLARIRDLEDPLL